MASKEDVVNSNNPEQTNQTKYPEVLNIVSELTLYMLNCFEET